jgi:trans-aconitate 2-methyltransferase
MLDWNPALYTRYEDERTRPAPSCWRAFRWRMPPVWSTSAAARAIPPSCWCSGSRKRTCVGIDNSEAMLVSARKRLPQARFEFE